MTSPVRQKGGALKTETSRPAGPWAVAAGAVQRARERVARARCARGPDHRERFEVLTAQEVTQIGTPCSYG